MKRRDFCKYTAIAPMLTGVNNIDSAMINKDDADFSNCRNKLDNIKISFTFPFEGRDIKYIEFVYKRTIRKLIQIEKNCILLDCYGKLYDSGIGILPCDRCKYDHVDILPCASYTISYGSNYIRIPDDLYLLVTIERPKIVLYGKNMIERLDTVVLPGYFAISSNDEPIMITIEGNMFYDDIDRIGEKLDILTEL